MNQLVPRSKHIPSWS